MDLWRSEAYTKFFDYLDRKGGFYYEVPWLLPILALLFTHRVALGRCTRA